MYNNVGSSACVISRRRRRPGEGNFVRGNARKAASSTYGGILGKYGDFYQQDLFSGNLQLNTTQVRRQSFGLGLCI
jgi:hypothetical protein